MSYILLNFIYSGNRKYGLDTMSLSVLRVTESRKTATKRIIDIVYLAIIDIVYFAIIDIVYLAMNCNQLYYFEGEINKNKRY
jgi:hypothetical protein